jgi:hypothetical protein
MFVPCCLSPRRPKSTTVASLWSVVPTNSLYLLIWRIITWDQIWSSGDHHISLFFLTEIINQHVWDHGLGICPELPQPQRVPPWTPSLVLEVTLLRPEEITRKSMGMGGWGMFMDFFHWFWGMGKEKSAHLCENHLARSACPAAAPFAFGIWHGAAHHTHPGHPRKAGDWLPGMSVASGSGKQVKNPMQEPIFPSNLSPQFPALPWTSPGFIENLSYQNLHL